jgi:hypothetical protein
MYYRSIKLGAEQMPWNSCATDVTRVLSSYPPNKNMNETNSQEGYVVGITGKSIPLTRFVIAADYLVAIFAGLCLLCSLFALYKTYGHYRAKPRVFVGSLALLCFSIVSQVLTLARQYFAIGFVMIWITVLMAHITTMVAVLIQMGIMQRLLPLSKFLKPTYIPPLQFIYTLFSILCLIGYFLHLPSLGLEPTGILRTWIPIGEVAFLGVSLLYEVFQSLYSAKLLYRFIRIKEKNEELDGIQISKSIIRRMIAEALAISLIDVTGLVIYSGAELFAEGYFARTLMLASTFVLFWHILVIEHLYYLIVQITFYKIVPKSSKDDRKRLTALTGSPGECNQPSERDTVKMLF